MLNLKLRIYWDLNSNSKIKVQSDEQYVQKFREIFTEAVNCRLRSAYPIGFELSGGLDSSSVVCTASDIINNNDLDLDINTFSYVFDDFPDVDERYYINKVLNSSEINHYFVYGDNISPLEKINEILEEQEQPFYTPNMSIIWKLRKRMDEKNICILLSGDGGDELVSQGASYLNELAVDIHWKKLFKEIYQMSKNRNTSLYKNFLIYFIFPLVPERIKKLVTFKRKKDIFTEDGTIILNKEFIDSLGGKEYLKNLKWQSYENVDTKKLNYLAIISNQYVLEMNDKLAAPFNIEPRYPYFDKRLIEFCYALPNEMKFKYGWNRFIQRMAMDKILPSEIQWRTEKTNFNPVYERNLLLEKEQLESIIFHDKYLEKFLDMDKIKEIYENYSNGIDIKNDKFSIWLYILLYLWFKKNKLI